MFPPARPMALGRRNHPGVIRVQGYAIRHMELLNRELPVMVFPVYLQCSAVVANFNSHDRGHFKAF